MLDCGDNEYSDTSFVIGSQHDREVNPVGHWPWMASIGYYNEKDEWVHQCGATLISSQHFLTAAHCMADYTTLKIHVGDFNFTLQKSQLYGEDLEIEDVQTHPNFAGKYSYNDVAVIRTNPLFALFACQKLQAQTESTSELSCLVGDLAVFMAKLQKHSRESA